MRDDSSRGRASASLGVVRAERSEYGGHRETRARSRETTRGMTRGMRRGKDDDEAEARERDARPRGDEVDARDDASVRAMMGIFKNACGTLRWGLPATGGLACWAAAAANAGDGLLGALSGSLLVGTTLGVCALIFAAMSATVSGVTLVWMLARRWIAGSGNGGTSGRDTRRGGGVRSPAGPRRAERRRDVDKRDAPRETVVAGRGREEAYGDWRPEVPVVDPRAPGRWGGREGSPSGNPHAWGTHKTPADFRRERGVSEDENRGSIGPNEWQSRAAYRQAEGFNDPDLNGGARAAVATTTVGGANDAHAEILKKFEPKERLLPPTRAKPQHTHIPTEMLIAMGGASLETHIGANGKDILKTTREKRSSSILSHTSRGSTTTVNLFGMGGRDRSSSSPPARPPADERNRPQGTPRDDPVEESSKDAEDARLRARARFQKNLSSSFDFEPTTSYESEFMSNVMDSVDAYHDNDDDDDALRSLRRTR